MTVLKDLLQESLNLQVVKLLLNYLMSNSDFKMASDYFLQNWVKHLQLYLADWGISLKAWVFNSFLSYSVLSFQL